MAYGTARNGILGAGGGGNLVISTWGGTSAARNIVTGQNLAATGAAVIIKRYSGIGSAGIAETFLFNSVRGANRYLQLSTSSNEAVSNDRLTSFNADGFSLGADAGGGVNQTVVNNQYLGLSFPFGPGFVDVVEWVGNGTNSRNVPHALDEGPGMVWVKRRDTSNRWVVFHRSLAINQTIYLDDYHDAFTQNGIWGSVTNNADNFQVGNYAETNANGGNYLGVVFGHNNNNMHCGTFTTDSNGEATITDPGFRPTFMQCKQISNTINDVSHWFTFTDASSNQRPLHWTDDTSDTILEFDDDSTVQAGDFGRPTANGFTIKNFQQNQTFIYWTCR